MSKQNIENPRHVAIIMDGNGRWAEKRHLPRVLGHKAGAKSVKEVIKAAITNKIEVLSLFAFSSENWQRPQKEVNFLMEILFEKLGSEIDELHKNQVQLRFIGDLSQLKQQLQQRITQTEQMTKNNTGLKLVVALSYGGRWDILQATKKLATQVENGQLAAADIDSSMLAKTMSLGDLPEPDLFIRTSGEQRISNFFLWQLAYSELYFPNVLWPDFCQEDFSQALEYFATRKRRFGYTSAQIEQLVLQREDNRNA